MNNTFNILALIAALILGYFALTRPVPVEMPTDTASQGKIDIVAVCEGALTYMTFPDAASAQQFVVECEEGKHPEVIDRYISDMNLGDTQF